MKELRLCTREISKKEAYMLQKSQTVKMSDYDGEIIEIDVVVIYDDLDKKTGEPIQVLVIKGANGVLYGTNSITFINEFKDMYETFGDELTHIRVVTGQAKLGRFVKPEIV